MVKFTQLYILYKPIEIPSQKHGDVMRLNILNHLSRVANGLVCLATHNFSENGADDYRAAFTSARELVVGQVSKIVNEILMLIS